MTAQHSGRYQTTNPKCTDTPAFTIIFKRAPSPRGRSVITEAEISQTGLINREDSGRINTSGNSSFDLIRATTQNHKSTTELNGGFDRVHVLARSHADRKTGFSRRKTQGSLNPVSFYH